MVGRKRRDISSAIAIASMGKPSFDVWEPWAFETDRSRRARHGRTDTPSGSSVRSGGTALTISSCSASSIFVICSSPIKTTILLKSYQDYYNDSHASVAEQGPANR